MDFKVTTIENGIRVVTVDMPGVESVSAGIWVGVGSRHENTVNSGISHFLEHMLFKGTRKRSARDIVCSIEGRGGYMNAFTQEESTCYYVRVAADAFEASYEILCDMVTSSSFPAAEVKREQGVIVEEIMMYKDQPGHVVHDLMTEAMWYKHPMGMAVTGTPESVRGTSRKDLLGFFKDNYVPGSIVASFAGKVDHDECVALVRRFMGRMKARPVLSARPVRARTGQEQIILRDSGIEQSHISMGFRLFGRKDSRRFALKVLNAVLGENMSSRLFYSVREKHGLAYSIHSSIHLLQDTGALVISGGFDKTRMSKAMEVTVKELIKLKRRRVGRDELKRAKDYVTGQIKLGMESSSARMLWGGEQILSSGRIVSPDSIVERIKAVEADEVCDLANSIFDPASLSLAGIAPGIEAESTSLQGILKCL
jgi:predicted Zn-dependent peptidase